MAYKEECIKLVQDAVNILHASQEWENHAQLKAQTLGLQADKRLERIEQRKELMLQQYLQSVANDLYDVEIFPVQMPLNFPPISDIPTYFNHYLNKLWEIHDTLHRIANDLVIKCYHKIAKHIHDYTDCLFDEIIDTRRDIKEGNLAMWEYHHVSRYQVSAENKHDKMERLEEKQGYRY